MKLDDLTITMQQPSTYNVNFVCEGPIVGKVDTLSSGNNPSLCGQQISLNSEHPTNIYITCQKFEYHLDALYVNDVNRMGDVQLNSGDVYDVYVLAFQPVEPSTVRAVFVGREITINVAANPPQGGTVTGGGTHHYLDTITLEAIPNTGYVFSGWQDGNNNNPRQIVVTANTTYTANFQQTNGIATVDSQMPTLSVYPNPATDVVIVDIQNSKLEIENCTISIIDLNGRVRYEGNIKIAAEGETSHVVEIADLPQGAYFVRVSGDGCNQVSKLVKR